MSKITPCLWFDTEGEAAMRLYISLFPNSQVLDTSYYGAEAGERAGTLLTATFTLAGQQYRVLNGGPQFKLNEAISLSVDCADQEEVDYYWSRLTADGGEESMCGWLKDKYGLSWQIVPSALGRLMSDPDPAKAGRVMQALMPMRKIDIATLERAHAGA
ncbi:MAG: VOC family protein [bacterium]|nr:VOC family protein [bacterium]